MAPLRLAFMGTPEFAVPTLEALVAAGHTLVCVYSQPPRPAGRGQRLQVSPVQAAAERHGLPVRTPISLRKTDAQAEFAAFAPDAAVVAAYGLILPVPVLAAPRLGCFNVHASLLPRWRGAAPIQRALLAGDAETGITIMQMDAGLDTGPMLLQARVAIDATTTAAGLHDTLAALGGPLMVTALARVAAGDLVPVPQPTDGVTYAAKLERDDGRIDFGGSAAQVVRQVNALTPWPGAWFDTAPDSGLGRIKVLAAESRAAPDTGTPHPGTLLDTQCTIACGHGAVRLLTVQRAGRAAMAGEAFLRGTPVAPGTVLAPRP